MSLLALPRPNLWRRWPLLGIAFIYLAPPASAAPVAQSRQQNAAAAIAALGGAVPPSFDVYPNDPCGGVWDVQLPNGELLMTVLVLRYRDVPMAHLSAPGVAPSNQTVSRLDPHSIKVAGDGVTIVLRCAGTRAVAEVTPPGQSQPLVLTARPGRIEPAATADKSPGSSRGSVHVQHGDIQYVDASGQARRITQNGNNSEPVLSPDGKLIAFIHLDGKPTEEGEPGFTSLWLADGQTGILRRLLASKPDDEPKRNLASFSNPHFSLDGGFLYIDAAAWTTSSAVHQVNVRTGEERFVIDGWTNAVIRTGPLQGYLLVGRHQYSKLPEGGSFNPVFVMRPDGHIELMVPGSDEDDGEQSVAAWLQQRGWTAW